MQIVVLSLSMHPTKQREVCHYAGCDKPSNGKSYCAKHMNLSQRRKLPAEVTAIIRSGCCDAKCVAGEQHDMGEQYCTKCKQPCAWKVP